MAKPKVVVEPGTEQHLPLAWALWKQLAAKLRPGHPGTLSQTLDVEGASILVRAGVQNLVWVRALGWAIAGTPPSENKYVSCLTPSGAKYRLPGYTVRPDDAAVAAKAELVTETVEGTVRHYISVSLVPSDGRKVSFRNEIDAATAADSSLPYYLDYGAYRKVKGAWVGLYKLGTGRMIFVSSKRTHVVTIPEHAPPFELSSKFTMLSGKVICSVEGGFFLLRLTKIYASVGYNDGELWVPDENHDLHYYRITEPDGNWLLPYATSSGMSPIEPYQTELLSLAFVNGPQLADCSVSLRRIRMLPDGSIDETYSAIPYYSELVARGARGLSGDEWGLVSLKDSVQVFAVGGYGVASEDPNVSYGVAFVFSWNSQAGPAMVFEHPYKGDADLWINARVQSVVSNGRVGAILAAVYPEHAEEREDFLLLVDSNGRAQQLPIGALWTTGAGAGAWMNASAVFVNSRSWGWDIYSRLWRIDQITGQSTLIHDGDNTAWQTGFFVGRRKIAVLTVHPRGAQGKLFVDEDTLSVTLPSVDQNGASLGDWEIYYTWYASDTRFLCSCRARVNNGLYQYGILQISIIESEGMKSVQVFYESTGSRLHYSGLPDYRTADYIRWIAPSFDLQSESV